VAKLRRMTSVARRAIAASISRRCSRLKAERAAPLAFATFHDVLERDTRYLGHRLGRPECLVRRAGDSVPFVEALVIR
jgi:hypothetical protein